MTSSREVRESADANRSEGSVFVMSSLKQFAPASQMRVLRISNLEPRGPRAVNVIPEDVATPRDQIAAMPVNVRERAEAVVLQLEQPVGMVTQGHRGSTPSQ